jgi:serine/threonine protein kinase
MLIAKDMLAGKYRLESPLAQGGMGSVWIARHVKLGKLVAVKFLAPALAGSGSSLLRFEREAQSAATLQSAHVARVEDFGVEDGTPYIVMELLKGEDLGARLRRVGRFSLADAARILIQAGRALRRAHAAGIVHRDLKPGNVFLVDDDDEVVKILDFGIAKYAGTPVCEQTEPGVTLGSPSYMSPEQAAGDKTIDHRSDLWSMAVVLFEMVTGVLPFRGPTTGSVLRRVFMERAPRAAEIAPDLPPDVDVFFDKALAKRRGDRFQTISELVRAFVAIASPDQEIPSSLKEDGRDSMVPSEPAGRRAPPRESPSSGELPTMKIAAGPRRGRSVGWTRSAAGRSLPWVFVAAAVSAIVLFTMLRGAPEPALGSGMPAAVLR